MLEGVSGYGQPLQDVVPSSVSERAAGLRFRTGGRSFSPPTRYAFFAVAVHSSPVRIRPLLLLCFTFPVPVAPTAVRCGDIAPNLVGMKFRQHGPL
jgi:hypothetical protein